MWTQHRSFPASKILPPVRLELTAFRLWDWRAAYCATEAYWEPWEKIMGSILIYARKKGQKICTHGGTRTPNLRFRRPTPYPLGHAGTPAQNSCNTPRQLTSPADGGKNNIFVRRPGIEPGSQEWESCMIPLHQRRSTVLWWLRNFESQKYLPG